MKTPDGTIISSAFRGKPVDIAHGADKIGRQNNIKIGTVVAVRYIDSSEGLQASASNDSSGQSGTAYETVYDVKVDDMMYRPFILSGCRALKSFYGPNNYFEVIHESADISSTYSDRTLFKQTASMLTGSRCIVAFLEGESTVPVILGFLTHPARKSQIAESDEIQLGFEFNGFGVKIDKDGAVTITAAGPLTPPIGVLVGNVPETGIRMDPINGPLTIEIDNQFNFALTDIAGQYINVTHDSPLSGSVEVGNSSDNVVITMSPAGGEVAITSSKTLSESCLEYTLDATTSADITSKTFSISADISAEIKTGNYKLDASIGANLKGAQMKVEATTTFALKCATMKLEGAAGELLSILNDIFTGLGGCAISSPVGPCAPIQASPQWTATVQTALIKLKALMG